MRKKRLAKYEILTFITYWQRGFFSSSARIVNFTRHVDMYKIKLARRKIFLTPLSIHQFCVTRGVEAARR